VDLKKSGIGGTEDGKTHSLNASQLSFMQIKCPPSASSIGSPIAPLKELPQRKASLPPPSLLRYW
jgi:hypothetical protein